LHVVVLGGYGVIGAAAMRRLIAAGHRVTGVGRSSMSARRGPGDDWRVFDIGTQSVEGWREALAGADVVVNASGALQDGARDDLTAIHETALRRLAEALAGTGTRFVQISAAGVAPDASTEFFRSKARGEAALSPLAPVILRPTLVLARDAYGGTALLRAAAALPLVLPRVLPGAPIHCVHIDDLAEAVLDAVEGRIASGTVVEVTGADARSPPGLIRRTRDWLGFAEPLAELPVPAILLRAVGACADLAGRLGWRSPLRSTALRVLADGVGGDPEALPKAGGKRCRDLEDIFETLPATAQERWFARLWLVFPLALLTLSVFWLVSGLVGLARLGAAADVLTSRGLPDGVAAVAVLGGVLADILLGLAILWRPWARRACLGMVAVSLAYLAGATALTPDLWADPLGPLVKVFPSIVLALVVLALLDER
jgi:uncharacterized protein YbjT (DUF2867 family)